MADEAKGGSGRAATAAAGAGAVGIFAGFTVSPEMGFALLKWLNASLGPVGFVTILTLGGALGFSIFGNWLLWTRLKEKDHECQAELSRQRVSWKAVVDGKDQDNKEIARTVSDLLVQVTKLTERAAMATVRTRSN